MIFEYIIIISLAIIYFSQAFDGGYSVDDEHVIKTYRLLYKSGKHKRPLKNFIYDSCYGAGLFNNPQHDHLFTTIIHAVNCCLIYSITSSMPAALLYMFNPVNNQTAIWLNGRRYQISILCGLLVWKFQWLFIPLYGFASFIHVSALALPVLMIFTDYWWMVPLAVGLGFIFGWKKIKNKYKGRSRYYLRGNENQKIRAKKIILYVKCLGFYFWHTIFPYKPRMYHDFQYGFGRYEHTIKKAYRIDFDFLKGFIVLAFISYEIFYNHNIWAGWWILFITQWSGLKTVTMLVADRYCSLAGIGLMVILNEYISALPSPFKESVYTAFFVFYILKYQPLFQAYRNPEFFHWYHINLNPGSVKPREHLADRFLNEGDPFRAFAVVKDGLRYKPDDFELLLKQFNVLWTMGRFDAGIKAIEIAGKYVPIGEQEDYTKLLEDANKNLPLAKASFKSREYAANQKIQGGTGIMTRQQKRAAERKRSKKGR